MKTRGLGPARSRRSPSAWSKSKLAKRHPVRRVARNLAHGVGDHQRQFVVMHFECGGLALEFEGAVDQILRIGQVQIFRHALEQLRVPAGAALFVDDQAAFCAGAVAVGISAAQIVRSEPDGKVAAAGTTIVRSLPEVEAMLWALAGPGRCWVRRGYRVAGPQA